MCALLLSLKELQHVGLFTCPRTVIVIGGMSRAGRAQEATGVKCKAEHVKALNKNYARASVRAFVPSRSFRTRSVLASEPEVERGPPNQSLPPSGAMLVLARDDSTKHV